MSTPEPTLEQLQELLPSNWVSVAEIPRRKPQSGQTRLHIKATCITFPESIHAMMRMASGVTIFFIDRDVVLVPCNDYTIQRRDSGLRLIHIRRLRPYLMQGEYRVEPDKHFSGFGAIRIPNASALVSTEIRHEPSARALRRVAT